MKIKVKDLVSHYWKMKVKKVWEFGPVWKVKTQEGYFCFKRWKHGKPRLLFAYHIIEQLWENGYFRTPRLIPDAGGVPFVEKNKEIYILTKWVGRPLQKKSKEEWVWAAKELAHFHSASDHIVLPPQIQGWYFSGKWLLRYPKRIEELREAFYRFQNPQNIFEEEVSKDASLVLGAAESALEILRKSQYRTMVDQIGLRPKLCHGNIKAKNFTVADDGSIFIIDFDSFRFDLPVQDLAVLFFEALSSTGWSLSFAQTLFDIYHQGRPIQQEEIPILKALLIFPHDVYKIVQKYFNGGKTPEAYLKKWGKEYTRFVQQQLFYKKWFARLEKGLL